MGPKAALLNVIIALVFVLVTVHVPGSGGCGALTGWMDRAVAGFPDGAPSRLAPSEIPVGPSGFHDAVDGGAALGGDHAVEIVVVSLDSTSASISGLRNAWLAWVEACVADRETEWIGAENDLETMIKVPAAKAMGQFPWQAYIREDDDRTGLQFVHSGSGARLDVITDPTVIAARTVDAGYEGPPVVLIVRVSAAQ